MAYVKAEAIEQARRMDLLTYLSHYEPGNLVHISGNNYCTKEHDSLKISNGKWYWFSRGVGGISALDYLMKVKVKTARVFSLHPLSILQTFTLSVRLCRKA